MTKNEPSTALIGRIYESAVYPHLWRDVLAQVASATNAATAAVLVHDRVSGAFRHVATHPDYPAEASVEYTGYWAQRDPLRRKAERLGAGTVHTESELAPPEGLARLDVYAGFYLKWGWGRVLGGYVQRSEKDDALFGLQRPGNKAAFGEAERAFVMQLMPHLRTALEVAKRLEGAARVEAFSADALESIDAAALIVTSSGTVLMANASARRITDARDGLQIVRGELGTTASQQPNDLRRLIAEAHESASGGRTTIRRRHGAPLHVLVSPCRRCASDGAVLILVNRPDADTDELASDLRERHCLTPAQARVAAALCRGIQPEDIGRTLELSIHTVRSHIKKLTSRLGVHTQAQLVAELLRGPGFVARNRG